MGSNPSCGAYLEGISEYYGADENKNSPKLGDEAQTSTTGNHEYLYLKSPNELTRTMVLLSKVNISIWGNPR
ncbi:MAG TPA: hypothetical protein VKA87_04550 [Nitrososphaeraceae archaeon]|nr:hypothetical protein [Nitrososphaeraceae archaeon]